MGEPRLLHYSRTPFTGPARSRVRELRTNMKPHGLWLSVAGEDDWKTWCEGENFALDCLACVSEIELHPRAKILRIADAAGIDALTQDYGRELLPGTALAYKGVIDWRALAQHYDGIIIAPYVWSRRLDMDATWYCGWDCASGCIWRPRAIAEIRMIETADRKAA